MTRVTVRHFLAMVAVLGSTSCSPTMAGGRSTPTAFAPATGRTYTSGPLATLQSEMAGFPFVTDPNELEPVGADILVRANEVRVNRGLSPLHASTPLTSVASLRAQDMVARGYFDHVDPRRGTVEADRLVRSLDVIGEIAELLYTSTDARPDLPQAAVGGWLDDEANMLTLLDPQLTHAGVGVMGDGTWWVVVLVMTEAAP